MRRRCRSTLYLLDSLKWPKKQASNLDYKFRTLYGMWIQNSQKNFLAMLGNVAFKRSYGSSMSFPCIHEYGLAQLHMPGIRLDPLWLITQASHVVETLTNLYLTPHLFQILAHLISIPAWIPAQDIHRVKPTLGMLKFLQNDNPGITSP